MLRAATELSSLKSIREDARVRRKLPSEKRDFVNVIFKHINKTIKLGKVITVIHVKKESERKSKYTDNLNIYHVYATSPVDLALTVMYILILIIAM